MRTDVVTIAASGRLRGCDRPAVPGRSSDASCQRALLDRVDALERALRPVVAVLVDVRLLREGAEGVLVGRVDLLAFLLEELDRLLLLRVVLRGVVVERLVGLRPGTWPAARASGASQIFFETASMS